MLRVVIDTSALVSYVLTRGKLMAQVMAHWQAGSFVLLSSPATRSELADVLKRPAIQRLSVAPLDELVLGVERFSVLVPGTLDLAGACRDPKDDKVLVCAVEGGAHYLVSSDRDLLDMRYFQQVAIVNPGQLLVALELCALESPDMLMRFGRTVLADIRAAIPLDPDTAARVAQVLECGA
jgi:putative PIN family toxin of toxin-antitoxin system